MTKPQKLQSVRDLLDKYQHGIPLNPDDLATFTSLVDYPLHAVKRMKHPLYFNQKYYINVMETSTSDWTPFAWSGRIKGHREEGHPAKLNSALRHAIDPTIWAFKKTATLQCVLCGSTDNPAVDHYGQNRTFSDLASQFISQCGMPELIEAPQMGTGWRIKDDAILQQWITHHDSNCQLRILCRTCNSKLGKNSK